jgi:hypothetical protein
MLLAVAVTLATPEASVTTVAAESAAEAPLVGAVNVTVTPLAGKPEESLRVTCSGVEKAVPSTVDCGKTGEAVMIDGVRWVELKVRVALIVIVSFEFWGLITVMVPVYVPAGKAAATDVFTEMP